MESAYLQCDETVDWVADADYDAGAIVQIPDGRAGQVTCDVVSGDTVGVRVKGILKNVAKTANIQILDGGKVYLDHSANAAHFKPVNDRDFYVGTCVGDPAAADTTISVNLNNQPRYAVDLNRDAFNTVLVGTAAAGGFGYPRVLGGARGFYITATSEAQKVDALAVDGFSRDANAIVEFALRFPNGGSGSASDFSVGVASGTHASDADSIAQHLLMHADGGATAIKFQSKDGTTTVTATDSTKTFTAGTGYANRTEVWLDMRNPADVQVYVDGVNVLASTVFDVSAYAGPWYPIAHLEKTTGTETADMIVDWLRARLQQ